MAIGSPPADPDERTPREPGVGKEPASEPLPTAEILADPVARDEFFYRAWCAKEAWYKALAPEQQARTVMRSINYGEVRQGRDGRRLVEGCGDGFRFAAAQSTIRRAFPDGRTSCPACWMRGQAN